MRLVFMGTPDFAAVSLQSLLDAGHDVVAVVTQPDKPKGRGNQVIFSPVKQLALDHQIKVLQPQKVKRNEEFYEQLKELQPECIVVTAFGQILPQEILDLPKYGCINVHASLLPKYRGAAPIQWMVINGEEKAGVTIMHLDAGCDTGDMIIKDEMVLDAKETGGSLHDKLAVMGGNLIVKALPMIENGTALREAQDDSKHTYVSILSKEDGRINFENSAVSIERLIRGMNPWPSAFTKMEGKMLKIWDADVVTSDKSGNIGEVLDVTKDSIIVQTGDGCLALKEIQLEGKKRMPVEAFLRGYTVTSGIVLG